MYMYLYTHEDTHTSKNARIPRGSGNDNIPPQLPSRSLARTPTQT
jgi:hypothetical protein